jgi:spore germination cell wall hydrolase CwlJ-like protein
MRQFLAAIFVFLSLTIQVFASNTLQLNPKQLIAATVYLEARGEDAYGMYAVATVIWNRAKGDIQRFHDVVLANNQFSCWKYHTSPWHWLAAQRKEVLYSHAWQTACMVAETVCTDGFQPLAAWNHYHSARIWPEWTNELSNRQQVGQHVFGYAANFKRE